MSQTLVSPAKVTTGLLIGIAIALSIALLLWFWVAAEPVRNPVLTIEDLPTAQIQSVSDMEAVLARPLFWIEREPVKIPEPEEVAVVDDKAVAAPLQEVRLLGVVLTGKVRTALLDVEGEVTSVQVGSAVQDWQVETITAKGITFVADSEQTLLSLERERPDSIQLEPIL